MVDVEDGNVKLTGYPSRLHHLFVGLHPEMAKGFYGRTSIKV